MILYLLKSLVLKEITDFYPVATFLLSCFRISTKNEQEFFPFSKAKKLTEVYKKFTQPIKKTVFMHPIIQAVFLMEIFSDVPGFDVLFLLYSIAPPLFNLFICAVSGPSSPGDSPGADVPARLRFLFLLRQPRGSAIRAEGVAQYHDGTVRQPLLLVLVAQCHSPRHRGLSHGQVGVGIRVADPVLVNRFRNFKTGSVPTVSVHTGMWKNKK